MDLQQLQEALQTGYGLGQGLPVLDSNALDPELLLEGADSAVLQQLQQQQQALEVQGWWGHDAQQEQQVEQQLLQPEAGLQLDAALADEQLLVNADSREQRWQLRRMRRQLQQSTSAPTPGSVATYYGSAAAAAAVAANSSSPSIAFGLVRVDSTVLSFSWQPKVSVTPAAVSLPIGSTATLQYNVKLLRMQLPNRVLLRGNVLLRNPLASPVKLGEVAVEAPAAGQPAWGYSTATCSTPSDSSASDASLASVLASSVMVPAKGQLMCSFVLSYPAAAPAQGVVFARAVTDAGKELISAPFSFNRPAAAPAAATVAKLGACAMVSDTFMSATDNPAVLAPSKVPASGTKAPAAAAAALGAGSSKGGMLLCNSAAYAYTATLGPYTAGQCGRFKVRGSCWYSPCGSLHWQHMLNCSLQMCAAFFAHVAGPGVC
jgi:chitodextrinase